MIDNSNELVTETIFSEGDSYFQALIADIEQATSHIDLEVYTFCQDELGYQIGDALIRAAKRGAHVRLLIDGAGSRAWSSKLEQQLLAAGVKTRIFHPFPWNLWQWSRSVIRLPWMLKAIYLLLKINSRNHRKICVIDKKIVYVGSMNVTACHLNKKNQGGQSWRDTAVKIIGADVRDLYAAFEASWNHIPIQERVKEIFKHVNTNPVFRLNTNWHRRRILYKNLLRRIASCKQRIWITNAYFVPDTFLLNKLKDAAKSGVDVRILLPQKSDIFVMPWASSAFYQSLLKAGVRIFEYLPSVLHAKTLILDDWMSVGSSNLNHRSLLHDLEVDVNIRLPESKQIIAQQFLDDLKNSEEIFLKDWRKRPFYQRFIGRLVLYLKYMI